MNTIELLKVAIGALTFGLFFMAIEIGRNMSKIDFLKKEIADADEWNAKKHNYAYTNIAEIYSRISNQKKLIADQTLRISRAESNIPTQKGVSKAIKKMRKAATEKLDDIQNNMEVLATELKSLKKPAKKVTFKAFNTTTKKPSTVTFKVAKKKVVKK